MNDMSPLGILGFGIVIFGSMYLRSQVGEYRSARRSREDESEKKSAEGAKAGILIAVFAIVIGFWMAVMGIIPS